MSESYRPDSTGGFTGTFWKTFENKDNETPHYERFYFTRRYVQARSADHTSKEARIQIGLALGYNVEKSSFRNKLEKQRTRYDALDTDIPLAYLKAIGVDMSEFETCVEADQELFEQERKKPRFPRTAIVRYMHAFYGTYKFPEGTGEQEAITMLQRDDIARFPRAITYPELLVIWLESNSGGPVYQFFEPAYKVGKDRLVIEPLLRGLGMTRV